MSSSADLELPDCLERWDDGSIHISGHRVMLYHVIEHISQCGSGAGLTDRFPTVPESKLADVASYCLRHWEDMLRLSAEIRSAADAFRASNKYKGLSRNELIRRMEQMRGQRRPG